MWFSLSKCELRRRWPVRALASVALSLVLVTTSVQFAANSLPLHEALFARHNISERTGIDEPDLTNVAREIRQYFNNDREPLRAFAPVRGIATELFTTAEVAHMADVKNLFGRVQQVQRGAALFLVLLSLLTTVTLRRSSVGEISLWLRGGAGFTAVVISTLGLISLLAFGPLFRLFHALGFPQGNYVFDPRTSLLVGIFPFPFWQEITLAVGGMSLASAALCWGVGYALGRRG